MRLRYEILTPKLIAMSHELHYQFHDDFIRMAIARNVSSLSSGLGLLIPLYTGTFSEEKDALDVVMESRYTPLIIRKDVERREVFAELVRAAQSLTVHEDPAIQEAAERAMKVLGRYGNSAKRNYNEETAVIVPLTREFEQPELRADLETLQIYDCFKRLIAVHSEFIRLANLRYSEKSAQNRMRMKDARMETDKRYKSIIKHMEDLQNTGQFSQKLIEFVAEHNVLVTQYREALSRKADKVDNDTEDYTDIRPDSGNGSEVA